MSQNKAAAPVLEHRNGQKRELSQTHKNILLHFVRFGKYFAKTCAVMLALLGLAAAASIPQGGGLAAVLALIAAIVAENWTLGVWFALSEIEKEAAICAVS